MKRLELLLFTLVSLALSLAFISSSTLLRAQSTTSGDVTGVVTDPSGAAIPGARVTIVNSATGLTKSVQTDAHGAYRFALLSPGAYVVTVNQPGFAPKKTNVSVNVGEVRTANLALQVGAATQTVTVTAEQAPIQTSNGNVSTGFTASQVALVPNGGGDLTATVQSTPGAVMNTQSGYGNFSTYGLPATSNLFTLNGQDDNDPFLNLNNSGATNLLLGQNDVQQVSVTNNGYSGQYGELGGANVNYVTKSGGNDWHGNAIYDWNGRAMNANNFFNNAYGTPRPFDNANQWAASFGGPIVKNKTFFFIDTEGVDVVLPTNTQAKIPSPAFQAATLANLAAVNPSEIGFYKSMFALFNGAAGAGAATAVPGGGCGTFTLAGGAPCAMQFQSTASNHTHEWDLAGRLDQVLGANDHLFLQLSMDRGTQATFTDPINPGFDIQSIQPQYQGQLNWTHTVGVNGVNQFIASASHYDAIFGTGAAARNALMPATLDIEGGLFSSLGGEDFFFPQGRNVAQYGLVDDYSQTHGNNTFKAGLNYKIDFVNDYDFGTFTTPHVISSLTDFYNGNATSSQQSFPSALNQPVRLYTLGGYLEDDIRVTRGLQLTLALRSEHDSNPICTHDCIARTTVPFTDLSHDATVPYNSIIQSGLAQAYPSYDHFLWQPRAGFAWTPFGAQGTVLRGGFGIFNDDLPGLIVDNFAENSPLDNTFVLTGPLAPGAPGNVYSAAAADNTAFLNAFHSGGTVASISATNPGFSAPSLFGSESTVNAPRYYEYNLSLEHAIGKNSSVNATYDGNHGTDEPIRDEGFNAFAAGFTGLPATAPDPRFGPVTQLLTEGISNYNGLTLSFQRKLSRSLQVQASYTWSHALDEVSNGGFLPFNSNTNPSVLGVQDPYNIRAYNYGNADYDVRHYFSTSYVWQVPFTSHHWGPSQLWQGWTVSGTLFARSGLPFTVLDGNATGTLAAQNNGPDDVIFANQVSGNGQLGSCSVKSVLTPCLSLAAFSPSTATPTGFGNQMRNQFRGPQFFDTDMSLMKNTQFPGWEKGQLALGVQAFNLLNHPNFAQPVGDVANPSQFGTIINTVSVPTSILGSFLGGDASPRIIQLTAKIIF